MNKNLEPRVDIAMDVLYDVFGGQRENKRILANELVHAYDGDEPFGKHREPTVRVGNQIWNWYSGGDTCHSAAERIVARWIEERLV